MLRLSPEVIAQLDELCARSTFKVSRSAVVRRALELGIAALQKTEAPAKPKKTASGK